MKQDILIGIDQSFTCTAVVAINVDAELISHFTIKTKKDDFVDIFDRANHLVNSILINLEALYDEYNVVGIALEGLAFGSTGNAARDLAGLQFMLVTSIRNKFDVQESIYTPTTIKKLATGSGGSKSKAVMIESLPVDILDTFKDNGYKKTTGLADLADAYWISRESLNNLISNTPISDNQ